MDQPEVRPARECKGLKTADANYAKVNEHTRVCNLGCVVPLCGSCLFPGSSRGNSGRSRQSRNGPRATRPPLRRVGRRADPLTRAWCEIRFSVHQRFPVEHQERAERTARELEQIPGNGRHRFQCTDWQAWIVFPCDGPVAGRRQPRNILGAPDRSQRIGQREHMSPRFMVDRETMAEQTHQCTRRSVCGSRLLRSPALRRVLHLRADGLRIRQLILQLSNPSIRPRRRRWKFALYPCTISM
jgi:hypothetical protein